MFDLRDFTLRDLTELGSQLRKSGADAETLEEVASRVVRVLYETLVDARTGERACALVRFFKTHSYGELDHDLREFAGAQLGGNQVATPAMKCLTLLATAGDEPGWNRRSSSVSHRAIPLASEDLLARMPMISNLLSQLGVRVEAMLRQVPDFLVAAESQSFNVFYVPEARGSPLIPDQEAFVRPYGIQSVLGFGGVLSAGDIFSVILFSRIPISRDTAALFRTLALNVKSSVLGFDDDVFVRRSEAR